MEARINMTNEEAVEILKSVKGILKAYSSMTEEITNLIIASAEHDLDTVDSKLLLQIIARYVDQTKEISIGLK